MARKREISSLWMHQKVCIDVTTVSVLSNHATVAKRADRDNLLDGSKGPTNGFGSLKVILQNIRAAYADCEVRMQPPTPRFFIYELSLREI